MINKTQKGKERKKVGQDVLSSGGGRALRTAVEEEGERPGFVMSLPVIHIPFSVRVSSKTCKK